MKKVLIVTRSDDRHSTPAVVQALEAHGAQPVVFPTDRYPTEVALTTRRPRDGAPQAFLRVDGRRTDLTDLTAVWYRRFMAAGRLPAELRDTWQPSVDESRRTLLGTIASLDCFHLDPLAAVRNADHKEQQLVLAARAGLDVPDSLFTNDPDEARAFYDAHDGRIVTKMQHAFAIYREGIEHVVFTNPVEASDLEDLDGLRYCPMTFQEALEKAVELRVTVVGKRAMAAAVDSQRSSAARFDWRRDGIGLLPSWTAYALPPAVESGLLQLTAWLGLNYAAVDFVVTPEGRHVFLEVNAVGEFFWLQETPGLPIADEIARVLIGEAERVTARVPLPGGLAPV